MSAEELEAQHRLTSIHGAFLIPSCCNPTTIMISDRRKRELADVIKRHQIILIEDVPIQADGMPPNLSGTGCFAIIDTGINCFRVFGCHAK